MTIITPPVTSRVHKFGDTFTLMGYNPDTKMYLYRRQMPDGPVYYEVFKYRVNSQGHVSYPKNEGFGRWAKCCRNLEDAERYFNEGF